MLEREKACGYIWAGAEDSSFRADRAPPAFLLIFLKFLVSRRKGLHSEEILPRKMSGALFLPIFSTDDFPKTLSMRWKDEKRRKNPFCA